MSNVLDTNFLERIKTHLFPVTFFLQIIACMR